MPTQFVCASIFLLGGLGMLIYGVRTLTGDLPPSLTPWAGRRGPWSADGEREQRQGIVIGVVVVMGGTILFVGGVGLMIVSLL